ncbi:hypothetical protein Tco_1252087, partial [Tanacetum coccineum]
MFLSVNKANKIAGPKEANHSAGTQDNTVEENSKLEEVKHGDDKSKQDTNVKPVDKDEQAFLEELERVKRQEKEANDTAEALRKEFAQDTKDLLIQAGIARTISTNIVNTVSPPYGTTST